MQVKARKARPRLAKSRCIGPLRHFDPPAVRGHLAYVPVRARRSPWLLPNQWRHDAVVMPDFGHDLGWSRPALFWGSLPAAALAPYDPTSRTGVSDDPQPAR
jgi:hypothetical protein